MVELRISIKLFFQKKLLVEKIWSEISPKIDLAGQKVLITFPKMIRIQEYTHSFFEILNKPENFSSFQRVEFFLTNIKLEELLGREDNCSGEYRKIYWESNRYVFYPHWWGVSPKVDNLNLSDQKSVLNLILIPED